MSWIRTLPLVFSRAIRTAITGVARLTHHSLALIGVFIAVIVITLIAKPDVRAAGEAGLRSFLYARQEYSAGLELDRDAMNRATASSPSRLSKPQAAMVQWLSKKYHVAPEPLTALVKEAYQVAPNEGLDPTLILAVIAVESGFNPFAQSSVGAQGLMQVMTTVHSDKFRYFGGRLSTFDPITNLKVGANVLQGCIQHAGGSVQMGLRYYVGAGETLDDGGYAQKVLSEQAHLIALSHGRAVPIPRLAEEDRPATVATTRVSVTFNPSSTTSNKQDQPNAKADHVETVALEY